MPATELLSVGVMEKPNRFATVGVPLMVQFPVPVNESPFGREPDASEHDTAPVPPLVASTCEYGVPTVPPGSELVVIAGVALTTTLENVVSTVLVPSVALIVNVKVPAAVRVPVCVQDVPVVPVKQVPASPVG